MAERTENTRINTYINNANAMTALTEYDNELKKIRKSQQGLTAGSKEWMDKQKEIDQVKGKMTEYSKSVDKSAMSMRQLQQHSAKLKNMQKDLAPASAEFKNLQKEIDSTNSAMGKGKQATGGLMGSFNALGKAIWANPLLALAGIVMGLIQALKQNDAVMKVMERTMNVIGAVTGVLADKVVALGKYLIAAFENPKQAMTDLYEFVKQNLMNRFTAFAVILKGIKDFDFKKIGNGVIQLNTGVENAIDKMQALGEEALEVANKQDEITKAMQRMRDEERAMQVLNAQRQGQIELEIEKSKDLNLSIAERQAALKKANELETVMTIDNLRLAKQKMDLIKAENALSSSNEAARQREADAESEYYKIKTASELKLQQIKNRGSKLEIKDNKEAEKAEADRLKAIEAQQKAVEDYYTSLHKAQDDAWKRTLSANEKELQAVDEKYEALRLKAEKAGQDIVEISKLHNQELLEVEKKHAAAALKIKEEGANKVRQALMTDLELQKEKIIEHYTMLMELEGVTAEQRIELQRLLNAALAELDDNKYEVAAQKMEDFYAFAKEVAGSFMQIQSNLEDRELQKYKKAQDEKRNALDKRLKDGTISEETYRKRVEDMDNAYKKKQADAQKKQFQREKAAALISAAINTAIAVTAAMAKPAIPPFPSAIAAGVVGGLQIAAIASKPVPEFKSGAILENGVSHNHPSGGMPVYDPVTGQMVAKVEKGEAIIPTDTTEQNRSLIEMMLANKGKAITPDMLMNTNSISQVDFGRASSTIKMEKGGFLDRQSVRSTEAVGASNNNSGQSLSEVVNELRMVRSAVENLKLVIPATELEERMNERKNVEIQNTIK
jgi:hypothetical protein